MKRVLIFVMSVFCAMSLLCTRVLAEDREMRGVWIATVLNLDFPSVKDNEKAQKKQFSEELDNMQTLGIDTVIVQVRPASDAFYKSSINPWSEYLTGTQGKDPGYDPLEYMIEETHKRGMEFHAWLNPYRVTMSGTDTSALAEGHPAKIHPDWLITSNGALYYNPANEEVKEYICDTVGEIVANYNVDGIHFDDYFYPSNYPLPEGEAPDGKEANARRGHVTDMVEMVYKRIKSINRNVQFGISPNGIYKNEPKGLYGSPIKGYQGYHAVYADSKTWIDKGIIDYIAPQIYWNIDHSTAAYKTVVKYWEDMVRDKNVKLYIGEAVYKDNVAAEMKEHIDFGRAEKNVSGNIYFSYKDIMADRGGIKNTLNEAYINKPNEKKPVTLSGVKNAIPNSSDVYINSDKISIDAYNVEDYNYFKLRDIAVLMMGTGARFSVLWDEDSSTIIIVRGSSYIISGGELSTGAKKTRSALTSTARIVIDGAPADISAYNIDGNNYYKLRDLASALGFKAEWSDAEKAVLISTD